MHQIDSPFVKILQTKIRRQEAGCKDIKDSL